MTEAVYLKRTINMVDELTLVALGVAFLVGIVVGSGLEIVVRDKQYR